MNCTKCGKEISNDMIFCPYCGERIYHNVIDIIENENQEVNEEGPWKNFAVTGSVLAKISLCVFWVMGIGSYIGALGIVFSCLGKKSKIKYDVACVAFKRALLATILSLVFTTIVSSIKPIIDILFK